MPTAHGLDYRDQASQHLLPHLGEGEERQENGGRPLCLAGGLGQVQEGEQAGAELGLVGACVGRGEQTYQGGDAGEEEGVRRAQGGQVLHRCQGGGQEGGQGGGLLVQCPALRTVKSKKQ